MSSEGQRAVGCKVYVGAQEKEIHKQCQKDETIL